MPGLQSLPGADLFSGCCVFASRGRFASPPPDNHPPTGGPGWIDLARPSPTTDPPKWAGAGSQHPMRCYFILASELLAGEGRVSLARRLAGCLAGCAGWLASSLAGWLAGCLAAGWVLAWGRPS